MLWFFLIYSSFPLQGEMNSSDDNTSLVSSVEYVVLQYTELMNIKQTVSFNFELPSEMMYFNNFSTIYQLTIKSLNLNKNNNAPAVQNPRHTLDWETRIIITDKKIIADNT